MGRTRASESTAVKVNEIEGKRRSIENAAKDRTSREKAQKSYREPSDSEESEGEIEKKVASPDFSDDNYSPPLISETSASDYGSSESEYGGNKKKNNSVKAVGKGRGRGKGGKKAAASPKGKGRGRGRAPAAKNGSKKTPAKRGRAASESEESEAESSGSEYGKSEAKASPPKRGAPAKRTPKAAPKKRAASPVESNRARRARPAKKSYKEVSEDEELEVSEEEKKPVAKRAKLEPKKKEKKVSEDEEEMSVSEDEEEKKPVSKRAKLEPKKNEKKGSEDEEEMSVSEDDEAKDKEKAVKKNEKNGHAANDKKVDKDSEDEEDKKSEKSDKSDEESEEEPKEKKKKSSSPPKEDEVEDKSVQLKNLTDTDFSKIEFGCDKKTSKGDPWNLKISCWNIGGIKSWVKKNGLEYLKKEDPDVMCLVEVKCNEKTKPEELSTVEGYPHIYWAFNTENSGHHGVAVLSKTEPKSVEYGFPVEDADADEDKKTKEALSTEGRLITLEYENHYLINAYVPNSGRAEKSDDFPKGYPLKVASGDRQKFDKLFKSYVQELEKKKPVIVTGDLNVSHEDIDLANPKTNERTAGFTKEEREGMTQLLKETTLVDSFRFLYPDQKDSYTFWSYMHNSRQKNIGWRLDYFLVSDKLQDSVCENLMRTQVYGSDHCPIVLFLQT